MAGLTIGKFAAAEGVGGDDCLALRLEPEAVP